MKERKVNAIFTDEKSNVHIGDFECFGFIINNEFCPVCNSCKVYYDAYDAKFCPQCNVWLEKECFDQFCGRCGTRPEKSITK